jgi:ATP-dependent Clp protease ATP-binding subunit ClpA
MLKGMNMDRFTTKAQQALQDAQRLAHGYSHQELDGEHLLLALIEQPESLVPLVIQKLGVALPVLKADLEKELTRRHKVEGTSSSACLRKAVSRSRSCSRPTSSRATRCSRHSWTCAATSA